MQPEQLLTHKDPRIRKLARYLINHGFRIDEFADSEVISFLWVRYQNLYIDIYFYEESCQVFGIKMERKDFNTIEEVINYINLSEKKANEIRTTSDTQN